MTEIPAALVMELRKRSGAGMMDSKRALQEADGDLEAAYQLLREWGAAQAGKRAGRETSEGVVLARVDDSKGTIVAVGSETEPVSKNDEFRAFAEHVLDLVEKEGPEVVVQGRGRANGADREDRREHRRARRCSVRRRQRRVDCRLRPPAGEQDRRPRQGRGLAGGRAALRDAHRVRRTSLRDARRGPEEEIAQRAGDLREAARGGVEAGGRQAEDRRGTARQALLRRRRFSSIRPGSTSRRRPSPRLSTRRG